MNYYRLCQFKGFQYIQQVQKIQTILHWMEKQSDYTMYKIDNNSLLQTMQWIGCIHTRMHARTHTHTQLKSLHLKQKNTAEYIADWKLERLDLF